MGAKTESNKKKIIGLIIGIVILMAISIFAVIALTTGSTQEGEQAANDEQIGNGKYEAYPYMQNEIPSYRECKITSPLSMPANEGGGTYYRLKNNQIMYNIAYTLSEDYCDNLAGIVSRFKDLVQEKNDKTKFLYVQTPSKHETDSEIQESGIENHFNLNTDTMISSLKKAGIDTIDMREVMHKAKVPWKDMFYDTDHHWNANTGLWVSEWIMNYMARNYDKSYYNSKLFAPDQMDVTKHENFYRGFGGRYTSVDFAGKDDFDVIEPKYDTNFAYSMVTQGNLTVQRTGKFGDTLLDKSKLVDDGKTNAYDTFSGGNPKISIATNMSSDNNGKRLLFIRDSFGCVTMPFFALQFKEVVCIDPRYYDLGTVANYVKYNNFDCVMMSANPPNFSPEKTFNLGV